MANKKIETVTYLIAKSNKLQNQKCTPIFNSFASLDDKLPLLVYQYICRIRELALSVLGNYTIG
ncbi:hypothetical protein HMPREF1327_00271 [Enterococcus faecalis 599]|nr:hypothetical protein HMPREF1327_00271 [Enterococcus faecalis 599]